jgi:hypothetical protein
MKGINCVTFIGRLVLASFPKRYFLEKKNNFSVAISSQHIDALFGNVFKDFLSQFRSRQLIGSYFCYRDCFEQI